MHRSYPFHCEKIVPVAKDMNIKKAGAIIDEVKAGVRRWKNFAKKAEVPAKQVEAIGKLHLTRI